MLRTEEHPCGLPSLTPQQAELVFNDAVLWFRFLLMYIMCEEVRYEEEKKTTALVVEQPEDPKSYRSEEEVGEKGFMSMWRTQEWLDFAKTYGADLISFEIKDQWGMNVESLQRWR